MANFSGSATVRQPWRFGRVEGVLPTTGRLQLRHSGGAAPPATPAPPHADDTQLMFWRLRGNGGHAPPCDGRALPPFQPPGRLDPRTEANTAPFTQALSYRYRMNRAAVYVPDKI
jgi:hypothetical protein